MSHHAKRSLLALVACLTVLAAAGPSRADIVIFSGSDPGVGPGGARPNSDAAAAAFDAAAAALGAVNVITFESAPLGNFASLGVAPGVTAMLSGTDTDVNPGVTNVAGDTTLGYNTTAGGGRFVRVVPIFNIGTASLEFVFATPVQAFGAYITGLGTANGNLQFRFNDGANQSLAVGGSSNGGVRFFGFTDAGTSISSVRLELSGVSGTRDIFGVDDVRFVGAGTQAVPEPGTLSLCVAMAACLSGYGLRRRLRSR